MASWRDYEHEIHDLLAEKAEPGATIVFDAKIAGYLSGTERQIDVWLEGHLAGGVLPATVSLAVDCKCWASTVNVPEVERFLGTLDDVGADIGLIVTTTGFSEAARQRASRARGLQLDVITFDQLAEWSFGLEMCVVCAGAEPEDAMPGMMYTEPLLFPNGDRVRVGACDRCQAVHIRCGCRGLIGVPEADEDEDVTCLACGNGYRVDSEEVDRKGMPLGGTVASRVSRVSEPAI